VKPLHEYVSMGGFYNDITECFYNITSRRNLRFGAHQIIDPTAAPSANPSIAPSAAPSVAPSANPTTWANTRDHGCCLLPEGTVSVNA